MIEMVPDLISSDIKSQAEKLLFNDFRSCVTNDNYIILHSLGLSEHLNNIFGEIDFVVICSQGVLCIEVKGGEVSCQKGVWSFINRYGKTSKKTEGPFQQAQGNMQSLRTHLIKRLGKWDALASCQFASCVIMPDCDFSYDGIEIIREILFDKGKQHDLISVVNESFVYWRQKLREQHGFEGGYLTKEEMKRLAQLLRGDFRFVPSMKDTINNTSKALCALTDEQYAILESLEDNERTIVSGVAGSGKTLLAMEQARRMYWSGLEVLYICFNHNISSFVREQFKIEEIPIKACTLHSLLGNNPSMQDSKDYFEKILPEEFLKKKRIKEYDYLIVDEGQDLFRESYVQCFDKLLKGGLSEGKWLFFYDQNQNIYNNKNDQFNSTIVELKRLGAISFKLTVNCRNTKQIADANSLTTGIRNTGRPRVDGLDVKYIPYHGKKDEQIKLHSILIELRDNGVVGGDFIILSRYSLSNSSNCLNNIYFDRSEGYLKTGEQIWKANKNEIRFSTIASFKGLESKVVILCDVDGFADDTAKMLNYVAISRATSMLYILYDSTKEQERQEMLLKGYINI